MMQEIGVRNRNKALFTSQLQSWKTPTEFYDILNAEFHFDFDPCPENRVVKVFGPLASSFDGLTIPWGKRNFVNPPYHKVKKWIQKGYQEFLKGNLSVFLIPARTDTSWFHEIVLPYATDIRFLKGRLEFIDPKTNGKRDRAPFPSMIVVFASVGDNKTEEKKQ